MFAINRLKLLIYLNVFMFTGAQLYAEPVIIKKSFDIAKKKSRKKKKRNLRRKHLKGVGRTKGKDSTNIDLSTASIGGQRKNPLGSLVNQSETKKGYDFIKIRRRWHNKMSNSASSLESGR